MLKEKKNCILGFFIMQPKLKLTWVTLFWCKTSRTKLKKCW